MKTWHWALIVLMVSGLLFRHTFETPWTRLEYILDNIETVVWIIGLAIVATLERLVKEKRKTR